MTGIMVTSEPHTRTSRTNSNVHDMGYCFYNRLSLYPLHVYCSVRRHDVTCVWTPHRNKNASFIE